ncbi:hypothetical protein [Nocardia tengchongensis]|uniref:hypothetical protein n=1 Tax=Nocardia tengchongensis TaxID=2055889 RepID=UPI003608B9E6
MNEQATETAYAAIEADLAARFTLDQRAEKAAYSARRAAALFTKADTANDAGDDTEARELAGQAAKWARTGRGYTFGGTDYQAEQFRSVIGTRLWSYAGLS